MKTGTPLTKEYFEYALDKKLSEKFDEKLAPYVTERYLDDKFESFEKKIDGKIEALAMATAKGFAETDEKLRDMKLDIYETEVRLSDRIDALDKRFSDVERHIGRIDIRFGNLNDLLVQNHGERIQALEKAVFI